jgi:hypothetical protein
MGGTELKENAGSIVEYAPSRIPPPVGWGEEMGEEKAWNMSITEVCDVGYA